MKQIYFVRHSQSEHNKAKRYAGQIDSPLTDLGREQAQETGRLLKDKNITYVISSTLSRAQETAQIIKDVIDPENELPFKQYSCFQEANFGNIQDKPYGEEAGLIYGIESGTGESAQELYDRAEECLGIIDSVETDGDILIVGHGSFTSVIFAVAEGKQPNDLIAYRKAWSFKNGEIKEM